MVRSKSGSLTLMVCAIVLAALALFSGCSRSPLMTDNDESSESKLLMRSARSGVAQSASSLHTEAVITAAEGGVLTLLDVELIIPPGAVDNDTLFTIDIPDANVFYNEFGTDGLVFNVPVTVKMSYRDADLSGVNESSIRICWFNERIGEFQDMACTVDFAKKEVTGQLQHFSAYGLISD